MYQRRGYAADLPRLGWREHLMEIFWIFVAVPMFLAGLLWRGFLGLIGKIVKD